MRLPLCTLLAFSLAWAGPPAPRTPNLIFVLVDDLGYGDLGAFYQNQRLASGRPAFRTPNLDRMAAEGLRLERYYCPSPVCAPSRASLLTGVHQGHCQLRDNAFDQALEDNHTLATLLKRAGYATAAIGKWGLQGPGTAGQQPGHPQRRGFDAFFGMLSHLSGHFHYPKEDGTSDDQGQPTGVFDGTRNVTQDLDACYSTDLFTAKAKQWLQAQRGPFFLYLAFTAPHARLDVPTQAYPEGGGLHGGMAFTGRPGAMITTASGPINRWLHPDYAGQPWPEAEKRHATMVRRLDDAMGDLFRTLQDLGLDQDTLVVFTSDNGAHNEAGDGGRFTQDPAFFRSYGPLDGLKRDCLEGGIRVPALVRWPGHIPAGSVRTEPVAAWDWMPTFCRLAQVPVPARSDGVSLLPLLTGQGAQEPSTLYVEYAFPGRTPRCADFVPAHGGKPRGQMQALYLDGFKGLRTAIKGPGDDFEIYDTLRDPQETADLARTSPAFRALNARMKERVLQLRRPEPGAVRPYDAAPVPPAPPAAWEPGLVCETYAGDFPYVPAVRDLQPEARARVPALAEPSGAAGLVRWTGYLRVPQDGTYTFTLSASGRTFIRLHQACLLDGDGGRTGAVQTTSIPLQAGLHPVTISWVPGHAAPAFRLGWQGPGFAAQAIPASAWFRAQ